MEEIKVSEMLQADSIEKDNAVMIIQGGVNKKASGSIQTATGTSLTLSDSVCDTATIKSNSKNLFDKDNPTPVYYANNASYSILENGIRIIKPASGATTVVFRIMDVSDKVGETFTLKADFTSGGQYIIGLCDASGGNRIIGTLGTTGGEQITYTIPAITTSSYLAIWLYGDSDTTGNKDYTNIQLEEGSTATDYNPYNTKVTLSNGTDIQRIILTPQEEKAAFTYDTETTLTSNGSVTIEYNTQSRLLNNDDLQALDGHLVSINSGIGSRVNFTKNKNLFTSANTMSGLYKIGDGTYLADSSAICTKEKIEIDNTKNYVLSATSLDTSANMYVLYYNSNGAYLGFKEALFSVGQIILNTYTDYSSAKYINLRFDGTKVQNVMLEEGDYKTTYETYDRTINIDDEKIYSKNKDDIYTTAEQRIGSWIDGKPLYRKVVLSTVPSGTTSTEIGLGVANIYFVQRAEVRFNAVGSGDYVFNSYYSGASDYMRFFMRNNTLQIRLGSNSSGFNIVAIVEYTKTTD